MMCLSFEPNEMSLHMDVSEDSYPLTRAEEVEDDELSSAQEKCYKCVPETLLSLRPLQYSAKFSFLFGNIHRSSNTATFQNPCKSVQNNVRESSEVIDLTESSVPHRNLFTIGQEHNKQSKIRKMQKVNVTVSTSNGNPISNNVPVNQMLTKNNGSNESDAQDNILQDITISTIRGINGSSNNSARGTQSGVPATSQDKLHRTQNLSNDSGPVLKSSPAYFHLNADKQYPCLNVRVKPYMRHRTISYSEKSDKHLLDKITKELIQKTPAHLMEWSIVYGLIRPNQVCDKCVPRDSGPVHMNLVQYTRQSPYNSTGGYVWRCEHCNPASEKTIFLGSIFENAAYSPVTVFKLIYHWINHTDINCVTSWVQVDRLYVKQFFALLRAVCISAVHEHLTGLGGVGRVVQVGIVSLKPVGDTNRRPVSVLGVLDQEKRLVRLRAVEPLKNGEKCTTEKMSRILKPLSSWIRKESIICTDYSINRNILMKMGFSEIYQFPKDNCTNTKYLNIEIQNYLKDDIPRVFKDSLFKLSRSVIQQFLEELTWREKWNQSPTQAFNQIITHIAEQTKVSEDVGLVNRLLKVSSEPYKDWSYKNVNGHEEEVILLTDASPQE